MKLSTNSYLLGWIIGMLLGVCWGLGHQSRWADFGPMLGVPMLFIASIVIACIHFSEEDK